jgi:hypothetical protein
MRGADFLKHDFVVLWGFCYLMTLQFMLSLLSIARKSTLFYIFLAFLLLFSCIYCFFFRPLQQKQEQIKPQVPEGHKQNEEGYANAPGTLQVHV